LEALLSTFVAALLAEWGDKTQLLVIALALRFRRPLPILLGVALAALANSLLAAFAGTLVHGFITLRAISLLVALSLVFAGASGLMAGKLGDHLGSGRYGAFVTAAGAFFVVELGDKTQFVTFALAAQYNSFALAAGGAAAGILAASLPAALLGERLAKAVPLKAIRIGIALLFLVLGLIVAVNALRLV
jgi:putative Ca2+/H+ antiporter (TMEM165/GDT1 family)